MGSKRRNSIKVPAHKVYSINGRKFINKDLYCPVCKYGMLELYNEMEQEYVCTLCKRSYIEEITRKLD